MIDLTLNSNKNYFNNIKCIKSLESGVKCKKSFLNLFVWLEKWCGDAQQIFTHEEVSQGS